MSLNRCFAIVITTFYVITNSFGQLPDLIIYSGGFSPSSLTSGEILTVSTTLQNIGNATSEPCHLTFYVSPNNTITDGYLLSSISVERLSAGAFSEFKEFIIPIPSYVYAGSYYIGWYVDAYNEVAESDENNVFYLPLSKLSVNYGLKVSQHIPYPIIFIHGLNSNDSKAWDSVSTFLKSFGWSNGGWLDFCLNQDGDSSTALISTDIKDFSDTLSLKAADFYFVNFDVNPDGTIYHNTVQSNQSAIVKQGIAMHDAIKHVLSITKKDKVILVCHSMGGLAAREYLQNLLNWQIDGQHHVAKLLTIGTPHGGSNQWTFGILDGYTEAVRDLRWSYSNGFAGIYLFGGKESYINTIGFDNVDVNCNGIIGDSIIGINQKNIPADLMYGCIIGIGGLSGDAVVDAARANINNYYNLNADTFEVNAVHWNLTYETNTIMKGLDEPSYFNQAYQISFDSLYFGHITKQSDGSPFSFDYDDVKFNVDRKGILNINVLDIPVSYLWADVYDSSYNLVLSKSSNSFCKLDTSININPGKYYLEIVGQYDLYSERFPYAYRLNFTPTTFVNNEPSTVPQEYSLSQNFPNPFNSTTTIRFSFLKSGHVTLKIFNLLGQEIETLVNGEKNAGEYESQWDAKSAPSGIYYYRLQVGSFSDTKKLVLMK